MSLSRNGAWFSAVICAGLIATASWAEAVSAASVSADWGLPQLMRELAHVKSASARFTERKTMHLLTAPLVTSGTLAYVAPDRLQKITLAPVPEQFVVDHNQVTIAGGPDNQTHTFLLSEYPQIDGLIEGIRATLAGDLPTLQRFYIIGFEGTSEDWQIELRPRKADLNRLIKWIRIRGSQNRIETIATKATNGDYSDMTVIEDVGDAR